MNRREFLGACGGLAASAALPRWAWAEDLPRGLKVTRIIGFDLPSKRAKFVGKNSRLGDHGDHATDRMVRLITHTGLEGLGNCRADEKALAQLLGKDPLAGFDPAGRRFTGPLASQTMPLWDLAGKVLKKPVYELLGGQGPERVPVYDGSIYFADLMPRYADRWQDRFKEEIDMGLKAGHRAFKIKIGRGAKWMPRAAGDARDVEVIQLIRRHAGPDGVLGVDANNGYDPAGAQQFLAGAGDLDLAWVEEMFPEEVQADLALKRFIAEHKWKTLVADGETQGRLDVFKPFIEAKALDVLQADMNRFGIEGILDEAAMARPQGIRVAPHNWGSRVGFFMQLHVARAVTNFFRAEQDPLVTDVLVADGYKIADGVCAVPDAPGFGLRLDEARFAAEIKPKFDLRL